MANIVMHKDAHVCILKEEFGFRDSFNKEFSKVTSEGYDLKAVRPVVSLKVTGSDGDTLFAYYFQRSAKILKERKGEIVDQKKNKMLIKKNLIKNENLMNKKNIH